MSVSLLLTLCAAAAGMMLLERWLPTTLALSFKGDVKRETRWLAQYGQAACTVAVATLVWRMDREPGRPWAWVAIYAAVLGTSIVATLVKRLLGRVRPGRPEAGRFLGPDWRHANFRESFPSSHSACAVALTVALARLYPGGAEVFWVLALTCAALRYLMDAHWPSDVLAGVALGYGAGHAAFWCLARWAHLAF